MEKMKRSEFVTYLDTKPNGTPTYELLGVGVTEYAISYNPQITTEKWIIEDNARSTHDSNQKQSSVSQSIYKDDPCYEFVKGGLDKLNYTTHILDIDRSKAVSDGAYAAKLSDGLVAITSYMGENAVVEYDLYYLGNPKEGTVTFQDGKPVFSPSVA